MKTIRLLYIALLVPSICMAQLRDENLLQNLPKGYKIDFQARKGNMVISEMVPESESVKNWTEMVTTQIFLGLKNATPENFQSLMARTWLANCKEGEVAPITKGEENGYPFSVWVQACPIHPASGKVNKTWFKAIKGNDSFYLIQKAFQFEPSEEQIGQWMQYFRSIVVCDTRLADSPCPKLEKVGP